MACRAASLTLSVHHQSRLQRGGLTAFHTHRSVALSTAVYPLTICAWPQIIARWYTKREHSSRSLVVFYGIAKHSAAHPGGFAAWRGIEVFLGAQTLVASVIAWFLLGTPSEVRWLDHKQKVTATARVMVNHAGTDLTGTGGWSWSQTREAFLDPVLYFQFAITFLCCVVNGAITTFGTVIETGFGFDPYQVRRHAVPPPNQVPRLTKLRYCSSNASETHSP
jgi:hypothetical protein